jgi:hypothetical protein
MSTELDDIGETTKEVRFEYENISGSTNTTKEFTFRNEKNIGSINQKADKLLRFFLPV